MTRAQYEAKYGVKPPVVQQTAQESSVPGFGNRAAGVINQAGSNVYDAIKGQGKYTGQSSIRRGFEATAQAFNTPGKLAFQALPEVARAGLGKAGEVVGKGFGAIANKIGDSPALQSWVMNHPEAAKALEEVAGTASAASQIAGDILVINQGAKVLQKSSELAARGVEKVGQGVSKVGEKLYKSAYTPTADEARLLQANQAKVKFLKNELAKTTEGTSEFADLSKQLKDAQAAKPTLSSDTALKRGIYGTEKQIGVQSNVEKLDLWKNKIEPALKNSKGSITKDELFARAEQTVANEAEPARRAAMQNALESLKSDYANVSNIDLGTANKIKSSLDKFTPSKIFKGQDVANELKTLKADMADAIREKTYSSLKDEGIKAAYRDYGNLKQLENVGIKALTAAGKKGGFGNFWTTIYDQATTPIKTVGGKVLYHVGNKLEFVGEKGVETLGQHLENLGLTLNIKGAQGGYIQNPLGEDASKFDNMPIESIIESQGGWKPGLREIFDTALLHKDKATLLKLLPEVPESYKTTFANEIMKIVGK